jgi:antitoxin VapB
MSTTRIDVAVRSDEVARKLESMRRCMAGHNLEVVVLTQAHNVAWLTAGATTDVVQSSDRSSIAIAVTEDTAAILSSTIEAPRLELEERLEEMGFTIDIRPWWETDPETARAVSGRNRRWRDDGGTQDVDLGRELRDLRTTLYPSEVERLRQASICTAGAIQTAALELKPGMTEFEIAANMARATTAAGGQVVVNLVASDERVSQFRHPLPTSKPVERYVMLVLCSRVGGLIAAATRLVHVGEPPVELESRLRVVAEVDAELILSTRAGRTLGDQFALAERAYADAGHPEAIHEHHQGGSIGYLSREVLASPGNGTPIRPWQAFAWNPSLRGSKSEDTVLLTATGPEILTGLPEWPALDVTVDGQTLQRPAILVL